jgi:hypothetical protein
VHRFQDSAGNHRYPAPGQGPLRAFYSKGLHRLFNTYGRGMFFPSHVAIGAVIRK